MYNIYIYIYIYILVNKKRSYRLFTGLYFIDVGPFCHRFPGSFFLPVSVMCLHGLGDPNFVDLTSMPWTL
jgi:hypothetical protein